MEDKTRASLVEKETLLKEIHHRVKNNMQVISSLLRLQAEKVKDKDFAAVLKDSQNRIQSMALVYNKLYQSQGLGPHQYGGLHQGTNRRLDQILHLQFAENYA